MSFNPIDTFFHAPEEKEDDETLPEWCEVTLSDHTSDPNCCLYVNPCLGCWFGLPLEHIGHKRGDGYPGGCMD